MATLPNATQTYYLQFNITYRVLNGTSSTVTPAQLYLMDAVGGNIEYDVHRQVGNPTNILNATGPVDGRCPQAKPFSLVRCTGHLHIGGRCMTLVDATTGAVICQSCGVYGNSTSIDTPGQEYGYLVKMTDQDFDPPVQLLPGQNVTLSAEYDSLDDHYGVMALFYLTLIDFDLSCPGQVGSAAGSAFGPAYLSDASGGISAFTLFEGSAASAVS
jgi:hypothetical protein